MKLFGSRIGYLLTALLGFGLAYGFASLAIDTGSYWHYGLTLVILVLSFNMVIRAIRGRKRA